MKFLVDAQLPPRLARALVAGGHDAVHTLDLPEGNRSTDRAVAEAADADDRVLVTKDGDFRDSHRLRGSPRRLLIVTTGNIGRPRRRAVGPGSRRSACRRRHGASVRRGLGTSLGTEPLRPRAF